MDPVRKTALVAGVLFIITFVASIPAVLLYGAVLSDANYVIGPGSDGRIALGALLEAITVVANIGTAVVLFPVLRRQDEAIALGYVAARLVEATFIVVGIVSLLAVVTLRQDLGGSGAADKAALVTAARSLVAVHDWTFLFGPGFLGAGFGNGILLGYLMYRSMLVPRGMAVLGLVGGPLVCLSAVAILFGIIDAGSSWQGIATIPEILWEASLGIYLTFRGFRPSPITIGLQLAPSGTDD
jgi:hypothetical protein